MMEIEIPAYGWHPRPYQQPLWDYLESGGKRAVIRWHRRAGKDDVCLKFCISYALENIGNIWFMLPEKEQARKAIWNAVNPHTGRKRIDEACPKEIIKRKNDQEMYIELVNGSTIQLLGSDRYDSHVGATPRLIVFSEYALANPSAWDYLSPMLLENNGVAIFNSTVRGTNHFWTLGEYARNEKDWFFQQINADESEVFTVEQLDSERKRLQANRGDDEGLAIFRQEYFNDPNAAIPGAFYGSFLSKAREEHRIGRVPYDPSHPVYTSWDLGISDDTAIWFIQVIGKSFNVIGYYFSNNVAISDDVKELKRLNYLYAGHYLPHDAGHRQKNTGKTIVDTLKELGLQDIIQVQRTPTLKKQIEDVRAYLPRMWFDEVRCKRGLDSLSNYHRAWNNELKKFDDNPKHDWASHGASALATFCQGYKDVTGVHMYQQANTEYNMFSF